jgi:hypothetical protein
MRMVLQNIMPVLSVRMVLLEIMPVCKNGLTGNHVSLCEWSYWKSCLSERMVGLEIMRVSVMMVLLEIMPAFEPGRMSCLPW